MKHDKIDRLIRLAWLEGWITTHGAYEKTVVHRQASESVSPQARNALIARLESALTATPKPVPLTIGTMLQSLRAEHSLKSGEIFSRIGLTLNVYRLMEHDAISPLKIPVEVWKRVMTLLEISADELEQMIRRTHQLVFFRPSVRHVLARYKTGKRKTGKSVSLEQGLSEMFAKAKLEIPPEENEKLSNLLTAIREQDKLPRK
ncbi:MAG: hypothetical protein KF749_01870 [Bacteroidetes bacterium]|nr:hypothetical protein [Bacteroidota bacterium]MCW5894426.1 hypothetical protein [Bacteroidota bacterium]